MPFKILSHTADIALRASGKSLEEMFSAAAMGMFSVLVEYQPSSSNPAIRERITVEAYDPESLLVAWLNELLHFFSSQKIIPTEFRNLTIKEPAKSGAMMKLTSDIFGRFFDPAADHQLREIKSATYHNLKIKKTTQGCETTIILDV